MGQLRDLTGQRFGRLVVIQRGGTYKHPYNTYWTQPIWLCQCDCGETCFVNGQNLKQGRTRSCGCLRRETSSAIGKSRKGKHFKHRAKERRAYEREQVHVQPGEM